MSTPQDDLFTIVGSGHRPKPTATLVPAWRRAFNKIPKISSFFLLVIILGCIFAPLLANHNPTEFYSSNLNQPPDGEFYFGTDSMGRDIYSVLWYGGRISIIIGLLAAAVSTIIGIVYGCISGLAPGKFDAFFMRLAEILCSIPCLLLQLLLLGMVNGTGIISLSIIIGVTNWMNLSRFVRTEVRQIRNSDYVLSATMMGARFFHVLWYHLLPNFLSPILFVIVSSIGISMTMEATLSFLGLGLPTEIVSLGTMLSLASRALLTNSWWVILVPGVFLVVTLVCITNIGHRLRREINRGSSYL